MNKWNYIFPKSDKIIIWGAGKKGSYWLQFLKERNRCIECFFDIKVEGYINDIPVYKPQKNNDPNCILLISPNDGIDEIFLEARKLGFYKIQIGALLELYCDEKFSKVSIQDLFIINKERIFVIAVRYLAIEEYYKKNNFGFKLYKSCNGFVQIRN